MKLFKVITPELGTVEFTAAQYLDAKYALLQYVHVYGYGDCEVNGVTCYLQGEKVNPKVFIDACQDALDAWRDNKLKSHVYVQVRDGSSSLSKVWKWLPKKDVTA